MAAATPIFGEGASANHSFGGSVPTIPSFGVFGTPPEKLNPFVPVSGLNGASSSSSLPSSEELGRISDKKKPVESKYDEIDLSMLSELEENNDEITIVKKIILCTGNPNREGKLDGMQKRIEITRTEKFKRVHTSEKHKLLDDDIIDIQGSAKRQKTQHGPADSSADKSTS